MKNRLIGIILIINNTGLEMKFKGGKRMAYTI